MTTFSSTLNIPVGYHVVVVGGDVWKLRCNFRWDIKYQ